MLKLTNSTLLFFVAVLSVALQGCPAPETCLSVPDTTANNFTISTKQGSECQALADVQSISIVSLTRNKELWSIQTTNSSENRWLDIVQYGKVPSGFKGSKAEKLLPGEKIEVGLDAVGPLKYLEVVVTSEKK